MALLKEIACGITETKLSEYRFNVVLWTKVGGLKMYLETNVNAVSKNDAIQTVRGLLDKARADYEGVLKQKWAVKTISIIKPTPNMEHQRRMVNKK